MSVASSCQLIGGFILTLGSLPQLIQLWRTKKSNDLNVISILSVLIGLCLMEFYAVSLFVEGENIPFFITNTMSVSMQTLLVLTVLKYRKRSANQEERL